MTWLAAATAIGMCLGAALPTPSTEDIKLLKLKEESALSNILFPVLPCGSFKLEEATIDDMQAAMNNGTLTSVQLVGCYVRRTFQTDLYINSLLQYNPDALSIAAQMDAERAAAKVRGPLHGIPFTVKDNIATKDQLETTAGSWALLGSLVPRDAHVVAKLREAGAVLFGKTTLSEWADMRSNNYSEGYSARGGQCRSAYNLTVNPGGSSSGSAVGVAANTIAFSLGTETDGSVINPAMRNNIVGFKPTVGSPRANTKIPSVLSVVPSVMLSMLLMPSTALISATSTPLPRTARPPSTATHPTSPPRLPSRTPSSAFPGTASGATPTLSRFAS